MGIPYKNHKNFIEQAKHNLSLENLKRNTKLESIQIMIINIFYRLLI